MQNLDEVDKYGWEDPIGNWKTFPYLGIILNIEKNFFQHNLVESIVSYIIQYNTRRVKLV